MEWDGALGLLSSGRVGAMRPEGGTRGRTEGRRAYPAVRVRLLGGFDAAVGGEEVPKDSWALRKAASLVKLLSLAPSHALHREQVMEAFWPDLGRRAASNNLRQALHAARVALHPCPEVAARLLASSEERIVLCPEGELWVDAEAFDQAARGARRAKESLAYEAAIDLYRGELLPEDRYEGWAEGPRAHLRGLYLSLLSELAALYERRGEPGQAEEALGKLLVEEPTNEEGHASLMRLYALSGRRAEALSQCGRLEALLGRLGMGPSAPVRSLREEIASGRYPPPHAPHHPHAQAGATAPGNLPARRTSFVGREREIIDVKRELSMTRLLTLTGAGGSGKTRLALEVARDLAGSYPEGAWLVDLAPLSEPGLVPQAVATALGVGEQPGRPLTETLADALSEMDLLLLLDNCEHLVGVVASLVDVLLARSPGLRALATSREPLRVEGEVTWRIPLLSVPGSGRTLGVEGLRGYESSRLFLQRARARVPDFAPSAEDAGAVAEICRRLDGLPLAIELAAARVGMLSVQQIRGMLGDSMRLLSVGGGSRGATARHKTLRGTLDWSHSLLGEQERLLFGRLSVFAGSFTLEAAEAVLPGEEISGLEVLEQLSALVDRSLVVTRLTGGVVRYRLLEPVRHYARERLEEGAEAEAVLRRHAAFFLAMAEEAALEMTGGPEQVGWLERLEEEHDNLRAALAWSLRNEPETALRLAKSLAHFWELRSRFREGSGWLEAALRRDEGVEDGMRAKTLSEAGTFAWHLGDYERASAHHRRALVLYRQLGDEGGAAFSLNCLACHQLENGDSEGAVPLLGEALEISRRIGDKRTAAMTLHNLAEVTRCRGDWDKAKRLGMESLALQRGTGDKWSLAQITGWLGHATAYYGNDPDLADGFLRESLTLDREMGGFGYAAYCLEGFADLAGARAQSERAAWLFGAAEAMREALSDPLTPADLEDYERSKASARALLDEESWEAAFAQGASMTPEEAIEYVLSEEEPHSAFAGAGPPSASEPTDALTHREREIAKLVAHGLTNRQIALELFISERTVATHVGRVFKKLEVHSREQVAELVAEPSQDWDSA